MASVIEEVSSVLGAPDSATNFQTTDACGQESARFVHWGELELVFVQDPPVAVPVDPPVAAPVDPEGESTTDGADEGEAGDDSGDVTELIPASTGTFGQWFASGHTDPTGLVTKDGLGVSATVGFLEVTYGSSFHRGEGDGRRGNRCLLESRILPPAE